VASRSVLSSGRVTFTADVQSAPDVEATILAIGVDDWRDAVDVFASMNGNKGAVGGLVRVYAVTAGRRVEVGRGRVLNTLGDAARIVARVRGVACERYDVTFWRDPQSDLPFDAKRPVHLAACAYGLAPTAGAEPVTEIYAFSGAAWSVASLPTDLYSVAVMSAHTADTWLWLIDKKIGTAPADGAKDCPPIYVPAGSKGAGAVEFARPYRFGQGLYFAFSLSPTVLTTTGLDALDPSTFRVLLEYA
jgi:hypothetical protein